jgi:hypothetical protein
MKYWEIIADNLSKAGWSWGCVSAIDSNERTIWIAESERRIVEANPDSPFAKVGLLSDESVEWPTAH